MGDFSHNVCISYQLWTPWVFFDVVVGAVAWLLFCSSLVCSADLFQHYRVSVRLPAAIADGLWPLYSA